MNKEEYMTKGAAGSAAKLNGGGCQWLTVVQLQDKLQISRSTVNRWVRLGAIKAYRFAGSRTLYFLDAEVDAFLAMNAIAPSGRLDKTALLSPATQ